MIVGGFSEYSQKIAWQQYRDIADSVGALLFIDMAHVAGLVAAGVYPNPVPYADVVTSTTHKTLRGPRGGIILARENEAITKKTELYGVSWCTGWPIDACYCRQSSCFQKSLAARIC